MYRIRSEVGRRGFLQKFLYGVRLGKSLKVSPLSMCEFLEAVAAVVMGLTLATMEMLVVEVVAATWHMVLFL